MVKVRWPFAWLVLAAALAAGGCSKHWTGADLTATENHLARADAAAQAVEPHVASPGRPILKQCRTEIALAADSNDRAEVEFAGLKAAHEKLEGRWYVRWGRRIEAFFWLVVFAWFGLGLASVVLGLGNPLGATMALSKEIVRAVPFANLFAWARDWLGRRLAARAARAGGEQPRE